MQFSPSRAQSRIEQVVLDVFATRFTRLANPLAVGRPPHAFSGVVFQVQRFFSILCAIPVGKLQANFMSLGMDFGNLLLVEFICDDIPRLSFGALLLTLTRGTGLTGFAKESRLFRSASAQRLAWVQKTEPSAFVHLIGVAVLCLAGRGLALRESTAPVTGCAS